MTAKFLWRSVRKTISNTVEHKIGKSAAALTYYLLFAMFPMTSFLLILGAEFNAALVQAGESEYH